MIRALGLIEVNGYLAAVEAADSALKAAGVTLLGLEKVNAAITVVKLTGDVGAVRAAVDAGTAAATALGRLRTSHVIPRLDEQLTKFVTSPKSNIKGEIVANESIEENKPLKVEGSTTQKYEPAKVEAEEVVEENIGKSRKIEIEKKAKKEAVTEFIDELIEVKNKALNEEKDLEAILTVDKLEEEITEEQDVNLNSMKVEELRRLARSLKLPLTNKQIKFAKKDELIKAIEENSKAGDK